MKEIVVLSGKGGTGKTSLTAAFAFLAGPGIVVADSDVDASNLHLLLKPEAIKPEPFFSGLQAVIDPSVCSGCGACLDVCRFSAIGEREGLFRVIGINCEGCGYCSRICPENAISMADQKTGDWYLSRTRTGQTMIHARLQAGGENSGKLVAKVKNEARAAAKRENLEMILIDGPPGIGCPAISSLSGAGLAILVTEPTLSGYHDLTRVYELTKSFNIPAACIINKYDLNPEVGNKIMEFQKDNGIMHLASIPYTEVFTKCLTKGLTVTESSHDDLKGVIRESWEKILEIKQKTNG